MEDTTLAAMLATNLDGSFEQLVIAYGARLYRVALRLTNSREDAEEVAQDALVRAYRALSGYEAERIRALLLRPWLYQITLNVVRNRVRRRRLEVVPLDGDLGGDREDEWPERSLAAAERRREMAALLTGLPERYRIPVVLRYVEEMGYGEIADVLGQPVGTVKANVHRGIGKLRLMMEEEVPV